MDTGEDFITPEFLNILFFQQKNLVIFPYVDLKHLHALEIFTAGYTPIDLESTALHDLKRILEFESSNSYSQSPTFYFIYNLDKDKVKDILSIDGIRCTLNSNENVSELANGSKFIFYNKKNNQFVNYPEKDSSLAFEKYLISSSQNKTILQDKIQNIKSIASRIFTQVNQNDSLDKIPKLLKDFKPRFWQRILDFTANYFEVNLPKAPVLMKLSSTEYPKKEYKQNLKDFSQEYEIIVTTNKNIGKEFVQLLHEYRSKKVNPSHLELDELFNPLKLYNYLRNHHWKEGIPSLFIKDWMEMRLSRYKLDESDYSDFSFIFNKLALKHPSLHTSKANIKLIPKKTEVVKNTKSYTTMPSLKEFSKFKSWLLNEMSQIDDLLRFKDEKK
jgi:hypothetical protein